ncbi:hypothetical protein ABT144_06020 [Streptomyces sp. NPDC002039]
MAPISTNWAFTDTSSSLLLLLLLLLPLSLALGGRMRITSS